MKISAIGLAGLFVIAGCTAPEGPKSGKEFVVTTADGSATPVVYEVLQRGKDKALARPFTVYAVSPQARTPLYKLSWAEKAIRRVNWKKATPDIALDVADITILSTEGMSPFYDYCFNGSEHAQVATNFCTVTLIKAMKLHRAEKERAAEATQSSDN